MLRLLPAAAAPPRPGHRAGSLRAHRGAVLRQVQYSTVQCSTVQYSTVQYSAVQYSTVQYSAVQYSPVQCSTTVLLQATGGHPARHRDVAAVPRHVRQVAASIFKSDEYYILYFSLQPGGGREHLPLQRRQDAAAEAAQGGGEYRPHVQEDPAGTANTDL